MNKIPKKLHMYWDNSPMSRLQVFTLETFHDLNPDWEIYLYLPIQTYARNKQYITNYNGKDYFNLIKNMDYVKQEFIDLNRYGIDSNLHNILRSDIFRYHILYNEGGLWGDFDIIWLKPLSHMSSIPAKGNVNIEEMGASIHFYNTTNGHIGIGILFSASGHALYKTLIDKTRQIQANQKNKDLHGHQDFGSDMWSRMFPTLDSVLKNYPDVMSIPYETFAPYGIHNLNALYKTIDLSYINKNVLGIHWFNGHVLSKEYLNNNFFNKGIECSMTTILKQLNYTEN